MFVKLFRILISDYVVKPPLGLQRNNTNNKNNSRTTTRSHNNKKEVKQLPTVKPISAWSLPTRSSAPLAPPTGTAQRLLNREAKLRSYNFAFVDSRLPVLISGLWSGPNDSGLYSPERESVCMNECVLRARTKKQTNQPPQHQSIND